MSSREAIGDVVIQSFIHDEYSRNNKNNEQTEAPLNQIIRTYTTLALSIPKGVIWMVCCVFLYALNDIAYKFASLQMPPERVILGRSILSFIFLLAYGLLKEKNILLSIEKNVLKLHFVRGFFAFLSFLLMGYALKDLKMASFKSIYYISPLILIFLSAFLLGEKITRNSLKKVLLGLLGVSIVFSPGSDVFSLHGILAVVSMILYAISVIISKKMSQEPQLRLLFYYVLSCLIGSFILDFGHLSAFSIKDLGPMTLMSMIHLGAFYCFNKAIRLEEVQKISPLEYTGLLWTILFGFLIFKEIPDVSTLIGAGLVILSGLMFNKKGYLPCKTP